MANLIIIAAIGMNYELGKENKLIWNISEDMKFFKEKTTGHYIIMGRKTYESIPSNLANRKYIVLSKNNILVKDNVLKFSDIDTLLKYTKNINDDMYVIGGAQIYKLFLNYCSCMYLTEILDSEKEADAYFPKFDKTEWDVIPLGGYTSDDNIKYTRKKYVKRI